MTAKRRIVLIGPPAAGKSRSGRRLAREIGASYADTDRLIQASHGPIPDIFRDRGEAGFREIERDTVARALNDHDVISLGGGAIMDPGTQRIITEADAFVVYLTVRPDAVAERIDNDKRPLISGVESWQKLVSTRKATYERFASVTVDTSFRPMRRVVTEIITALTQDGVIDESQTPAQRPPRLCTRTREVRAYSTSQEESDDHQ